MEKHIFVFGSNLRGIHGAGSAKEAYLKYGAKIGVGVGRTGSAYAIPTKGFRLEVLPLNVIQHHVGEFLIYALDHPELIFDVVPVGCGLAGYKPWQIAPLFSGVPSNVNLPYGWREMLDKIKHEINWIDGGIKCHGIPPDPAFPNGRHIGNIPEGTEFCHLALPYPAKQIGTYKITCNECRAEILLSTRGLPDDPRSVKIPCIIRPKTT